ncbi:MAG: hypothetical protein NC299_12680 [Lachnospiraceae bacterium]|nr:hypothetical protein [Ruminococcus sp.]MCM1276195.1 hypothetical protein [Lachnospiraceae bacterium]
MGFFGRLFGKKTPEVSEKTLNFTIDIQGDCFIINGSRLEVPMHIDALAAVLGEPRRVSFKTKLEDREFLERLHGEPVTDRVNYAWDELGLMCYTYNGKVVNTFGICFRGGKSPSNPKGLFGGTVLIGGQPWFPVMMSGEDCEVLRELYFGEYLLTAEYADFDQDDGTRTEKDFTGIEIQLKNG